MAKIIIENINVSNLPNAIRGMRNPLESWNQSDSIIRYLALSTSPPYTNWVECEEELRMTNRSTNEKMPIVGFKLGEKDRELALKLIRGGSPHCKFMRQIGFIADITAPMTWWWDFDTYKVATVKNSTSRMHKLGAKLLSGQDFAWDTMGEDTEIFRNMTLDHLNSRIKIWRAAKKDPQVTPESLRKLWRSIVDDLPQSYMFRATWSGNYQTLRDVNFWRDGHKQTEFDGFRTMIKSLPCSELITAPFEKPTQ